MLLATELITPSQIYWITRFDGLRDLFEVFTVGGFFAYMAVFVLVSAALDRDFDSKARKLFAAVAFLVALIAPTFGLLFALTPTTKEAVIILGLPAIVNNEKVQRKAADALDGTEDLLKLAKSYVAEKLSVDKPKAPTTDDNR